MKNIRNTIWYRALKTVFIVAFIITTISSLAIIYVSATDEQKTIVNCDSGKRLIKNFTYLSETEKYEIYRECSEADYRIAQSKTATSRKVLSESQRSELDQIVIGMMNNKNSDKEIQMYVDNYKEANGTPFDPAKYGAIPTEKGKSYTFKEVFGDMDTSNGFVKKTDDVSILSNYKTSNEPRFSIPTIIGLMFLGLIGMTVIFWVIARIFFYIIVGEKFFKIRRNIPSDNVK